MASQSTIDRGYNAASSSLTGQGIHPSIILDTGPCLSLLYPGMLLGDNRRKTVVSRGPKQTVSLNTSSVQIRIIVHPSGSGKIFL